MNSSPAPLSPQDEHILAALSHITVLVPTVGLIAPVIIWATQKERSRFVAFQALQAAAFQLAFLLIMFVGMACYMASFFGMFLVAGVSEAAQSNSVMGFGFLFPVFIFFGMMLLSLGMVIAGVFAAVMTFQGKDFHYPLIGGMVERSLKNGTTVNPPSGSAI